MTRGRITQGEVAGESGGSARQTQTGAPFDIEEVFRHLPLATAVVDRHGLIRMANTALASLLGETVESLCGASLGDWMHPEDRGATEVAIAGLAGGDRHYEIERRYRSASGETVQVLESIGLVRDAASQPLYYVVQLQDVTGRREAAAVLQDRESRLRLVIEQIPAVVWTTDRELRVTSGVGRRLDLLDVGSDAARSASLFDYLGTSDPEFPAIAAHQRALRGESVTFEVEWLGRVFRTHVEPLRDAATGIAGAIGCALDVTEIKQAEDAVRASERKFRSLAETITAAAFIFVGQRLVYANPAAEAVTGFTRDELERMTYWDMIHPAHREEVLQREQARQRGEPVASRLEIRFISKSGEERWVDYTGAVIDYQGEHAVLGTAFDITERKRAAEALREGEERFRAIFEKSPLGMAVVDRDRSLIDVNDALCGMMGFARQDLLGMTVEEASHPAESERNLRDLQRLVDEGDAVLQRERRFVRHNGETGWFRVSASALRDRSGQPTHWLVMLEDVTEYRRSEEQARAHRAELGRVLRLRSMGELAAGLAHELNQPLAAVVSFAKGCVHRLQAGALEPRELVEKLDQIAAEALRAGSIIHAVQRFLRKEAPRREPTDVGQLVANIVRLVDTEAHQSSIDIRLALPPDLPLVPVEAVQIEQVLFNLVRNGLDAIQGVHAESGEIEIAARVVGRHVHVSSRDTGPGLGPGDPERIFEPFYSSKSEGMGLGLAISRSIVEAHGGRLWVEATGAGGTTFRFTLPIDATGRD